MRRSADSLLLDHIKHESSQNFSLTTAQKDFWKANSNSDINSNSDDQSESFRSTIGDFGVTEDRAIALLENFETAFEQLRTVTGIDDPQQVADSFSDSETQCHQLFRFVDEQMCEIDRLRRAVNDLVQQRRVLSTAATTNPSTDDSQTILLHEADKQHGNIGEHLMEERKRQTEVTAVAVSQAVLRLNVLVAAVTYHLSGEAHQSSLTDTSDSRHSDVLTLKAPNTNTREIEIEMLHTDVERCLIEVDSAVTTLLQTRRERFV
jgi:hypothetical protein